MTSTVRGELILQQLASGRADPILVADFQPFSGAPRLSRLLCAGTAGRPVYQVDPLGALSAGPLYVPLPELAGACAGAFLATRPAAGRVFLVGHCSAAGLSLRIAQLLEASREITVILVQPTWPGDEHITVRFAEFQADLGAANHPCPDLDGDPHRSIAEIERILRGDLTELAANLGLDRSADAFGDLLARYRGWLAFLLACRNDPPAAQTTAVATVKVLTDTPASVAVPALNPGTYQICRLPSLNRADAVTPELAGVVLGHVSAQAAST